MGKYFTTLKAERVGPFCPQDRTLLVPYDGGFLCRRCETLYKSERGRVEQKTRSPASKRGEGVTVVFNPPPTRRIIYDNMFGVEPREVI